jgi:hypothetical protein
MSTSHDQQHATTFDPATLAGDNITLAGYDIVAIPLAAGALAFAGISMPPAVAAILMSMSTIVVAANAKLLRRVELRPNIGSARSGAERLPRISP